MREAHEVELKAVAHVPEDAASMYDLIAVELFAKERALWVLISDWYLIFLIDPRSDIDFA